MPEKDITVHYDCRFFQGDRPCVWHKKEKVRCMGCRHYEQIETRILVVKLDSLGDVLRTTSILYPLKEHHRNAHISWITRAEAAPLLQNNSLIDRLLIYNAASSESPTSGASQRMSSG